MSIDMEKTGQQADIGVLPVTTYTIPRVNLLPPEIAAERRFKSTRIVLGLVTVGVIAALGTGFAWSVHEVHKAEDALAAEQATATKLEAEKARYAEVPKVLNALETTELARSQAMSADIAWYAQIDQINAEYPQGMRFKSLSMTLYGAGGNTTALTPDPLNPEPVIGSIQVDGVAPSYVSTAQWYEALEAHPGFANPFVAKADLGWDEEYNANLVSLTSSVQFTDELLTHRFDRKAK